MNAERVISPPLEAGTIYRLKCGVSSKMALSLSGIGISYAGTPYHLLDRDPMGDDLESVMLEQTDIGSWVTETQTAIEDADALNVDQAYRLTLLELGITDDTDAS